MAVGFPTTLYGSIIRRSYRRMQLANFRLLYDSQGTVGLSTVALRRRRRTKKKKKEILKVKSWRRKE